jgi:DNA repair protein RAD16
MKPVLKVGDIVWASAGFGDGSYEEPATIIEVNVEYDESGDESDEEEKNQGQRHGGEIDGVRIKYKISLTETVLPSDQVRLFTPDTSRRRRRYKIPHSANGSLSEPSKQGSRVYPSGGGIPSFQSGTENEVKSRTILASTAIEERQNQASSTRSNAGAKMTLKVKDVHISKNEDDEEPLVNLKTGTVKSKTRSKKRKMDASRIDEKPKIVSNKSSKKAKRNSESSSSAANSKHSVRTSKVISSPYFDSEKAKTNIEVNTKEDSSSKIEMKGARMRDFKKSKVSNDDCGAIGGEPDGNGGLDQGSTYIVEYAKTSRSTCKRCNERIKKGELRIGNRPLFRGKPGFQVFKHLKCTVFSEEISCAEDIGGSSKLKGEDYESLTTRVQASVKELKRESEELTPDELVQKEFSGDIRSAPKGLSAELLPFQIEGVSWMYHQETKTDIKGGILADEMGMGKTLQTITTILDNRPKLQRSIPGSKYPPCTTLIKDAYIKEEALWDEGIKDWKHEMVMNDVHKSILTKSNKNGSGGGARAGTLVICPLIALLQWKTEIEKFSQDGSISVKIYHGPDRSSKVPREMLRKYDIVLTTYQVLQADFRKMVSPNRVKCPNCGGKFRIDKLRVHLKYFCGENAERTEAQARQRRNSDQQRVNQTRRRGGHLNTNNSKPKSSKTKMAIKVKGNANYDSESELSMDSNDNTEKKNLTSVRRRPSSRASASNAAKKMTKTSKWEDKISGSDTDDEYEEESEEESDSNDNHSFVSGARKTAPRKKTKLQSKNSRGNEYTNRAVAKQAKALKTAKLKKFDKKKESKLKTNAGKGKKVNQKKNVPLKKGKGEQKNCSESDDSSEDDDDIDMDALIEEAMAGAQMSMLHSFSWWRIVLDEAHMIKSRSSQTAAAAFALIGIHRWCLSGTPLQNRVGEFYSLVRFLRLDPMAYYFCRAKGCDCKQIHYRMSNGRCKVSIFIFHFCCRIFEFSLTFPLQGLWSWPSATLLVLQQAHFESNPERWIQS